jgi:xRRM domain
LKPLVAELVEGRAEEIYWDKVPHKIRMAALAKSHAFMEEASRLAGQKGLEAEEKRTSEEPGNGARENKRRRKA